MFRNAPPPNPFSFGLPATPLRSSLNLPGSPPVTSHPASSVFLGTDRFSLWIAKVAVLEFGAIAVSAYVTSALYHTLAGPALFQASRYAIASLIIAALYLCTSVGFGDYRKLQQQRYQQFVWGGLKSVAFALAFFLSGMFVLKIAEDYSRATFIFQIAGICATVLGIRGLAFSAMRGAIASGRLQGRRAILVGDAVYHDRIVRRLEGFGVRTIERLAFASFDDHRSAGVKRTLDVCRALHPDDILILAKPDELPRIAGLVDTLSRLPVAVHVVPVGVDGIFNASRLGGVGDVTTIEVLRPPLSGIDVFVKRMFDIVAASVGLLVFSPMFLIVAAAIKLDTRGPIFFRQLRHGYNNRTISVFKFRSMIHCPEAAEFKQTERNDARVTRVGRIIRRSSIDELPQLLNVLRGEMSIVGPRPHATAHNEMFEDRISPLSRRHNVKPGITGWAQVNRCRGETDTLEKMQTRIDLDLYYVDNWSFLLDLRIIIMTLAMLFSKREYFDAY